MVVTYTHLNTLVPHVPYLTCPSRVFDSTCQVVSWRVETSLCNTH